MNLQYLKCPLTNLFFYDPVLADDGIVYERMAIEFASFSKNLKPVPLIKNIIENLDEIYKQNQFLRKKPYFLFKTEFINDLKNKRFENLLQYVEIILTDYINLAEITIALELLSSCDDENIIKHIINNSIDYDMYSTDQTKLIHIACTISTPEIVRFLIEDKKVNILEPDNKGNLPLHLVAKYFNNIEDIKHIFTKEMCEQKNKNGISVANMLCKYIDNKYKDVIEIISNIISNESEKGLNCFHYICLYASNNNIKDFLNKFTLTYDIEIKTKSGENFHDLIYKNNNLTKEEKIEILFEYCIHIKNKNHNIIENYLN